MASSIGKRLAQKGFFPQDIPPIFTSMSMGKHYRAIYKLIVASQGTQAQSNNWTNYEVFSLPRPNSGRRVAGIVNPIPFIKLSEVILVNWKNISGLYKKSKISFSEPKFNSKSRAVSSSDFNGFRGSQIVSSAGYSYVLYADFSRYFPTIYTHALEWAVHTKATAKAALRRRPKPYLWGSKLDEFVREMQDGQTQGLPIGPDTSYIIAELLGSAIDAELERDLGFKLVGARLIDDYVLYFESKDIAENALSSLFRISRNYQIGLNPEKTKIEAIFSESKEAWTYILSDVGNTDGVDGQKRAIIRYTDLAIDCFHKYKNPSIGRYAIKAISSIVIHPKNIDLTLACLMRLGKICPASIQDIAKFCVSYHKQGYRYSKPAVSRFVCSALMDALKLGHDCEASWLIWSAIKLKVKLPPDICAQVSDSNSSVILLLGKLAENMKLASRINQKVLPNRLVPEDFKSANWLLAYEGAMKGWFGWNRANIHGSILESLEKHDVEFLIEESDDALILKRKANSRAINLDSIDFDELDDIFELNVQNDGYDLIPKREDEDEDEEDEELFTEFLRNIND